jgi:vacuolar-type H+-ATPase subunit F/Vma7
MESFRDVVLMRIAIIADIDTVRYFKLSGLEYGYDVKNAQEAEERIRELLKTPDFALIIITDHIANQIRATINELIKRKTGIELRL